MNAEVPETANAALQFLAAEPGLAAGWTMAALLELVWQWGWLAGLVLLAAIFPLRRVRNPLVGFVLACMMIIGLLLMAASVALRVGLWARGRNAGAAPSTEVRRPSV